VKKRLAVQNKRERREFLNLDEPTDN